MPLVSAGDIQLNYVEHGSGDNVIVFIHGNLGCANWMDCVWPRLPRDLHVYAIEWRGCGDSDKPAPDEEYSNYSMSQHGRDMLAAIDSLGLEHCHLATHSTGGIISTYMLLAEPQRFGRVLALDPVAPRGLPFVEASVDIFKAMKADPNVCFAGLATAAPTLFEPESVAPGKMPVFAAGTTQEQREVFQRIVDRTAVLSDGIWLGTAYNLGREFREGAIRARQTEVKHPHLVLWGEHDAWIPREDMDEMAREMPDCRLQVVPGVGHSLNLENPDLYARHFRDFFS